MAQEKIGVEIDVQGGKAQKEIDKVAKGLKQFNEELDRNYDGVKLIDAATGDAASTYLDFKDKLLGGIKAVKGLSTSFKGLKSAILATGVGALVVAIGAIAVYWEDIKQLISGVSKEQEDLLAIQTEQANLAQQNLDAISASENILKLQGKTEREILELKKAQTDETIAALEAQLETQEQIKKDQVEQATRYKELTATIVGFLLFPFQAIAGSIDAITAGLAEIGLIDNGTQLAKGMREGIAGLLFDPEKIEAEADEGINETKKQLERLKNQRAGFQLTINKQDKDASDARLKEQQDAYDKELAALQKRLEKELNMRRESTKKVGDIRRSFFEKNLEENEANELLLQELEREKIIKEIEESAALEAQKRMAIAEVDKFYDKQAADIKQRYDDEEIERDKAVQEAKQEMALNTLGNIASAFNENTAAAKGAAVAAALINTYQGITTELATKTATPFEFALKLANIASTAAIGFKAVKNILSTDPKGENASGKQTATVSGGRSAPSFNVVGDAGTDQIASAISEAQKEPARAYVVSSDVTTAQQLERNTIESASI